MPLASPSACVVIKGAPQGTTAGDLERILQDYGEVRVRMGRHDRLATSVAKKLMQKQEEGVSASPDTRVKNPKKLPEPSPEPVTPPKKEYRI